jgi:hypothetical protein
MSNSRSYKAPADGTVMIEEGIDHGQPTYLIRTPAATYVYHADAGGFASIVDQHGADWINHSSTGNARYPESGASDFRGIPNMVHLHPGDGISHPGFALCKSSVTGPTTIETTSNNGLWAWRWHFSPSTARLEMLRIDTTRAYWFLYEGVISGTYQPFEQSWGTDVDGLRADTPDFIADEGVEGQWQHVFLGANNGPNTFFVATLEPSALPSLFGYLGATFDALHAPDGMVVLGLGRSKGNRKMLSTPIGFLIGFVEANVRADTTPARVAHAINLARAEPAS